MIVKPSALNILKNLVWYLDEPFSDSSSVPTYYVCQAARQHVTVALSGDGGDEVFAGYTRYLQIDYYRKMGLIPKWIRLGIFKPLTQMLPFIWPGWNYLYALGRVDNGIPINLGIYPYIQEKLYTKDFKRELQNSDPFELTNQILQRAQHLDLVSRYQYLDTHQYLPADILVKVDRMSMANSLEVRSPLLDYNLVEYMATLPVSFKLRNGISKYVFRKLCKKLLPSYVLTKRKQGFAIPKDLWFQKELRTFANEILLDPKTLKRGFFQKDTLMKLLKHHTTGKRDYSTWIWTLIVLEMWFRIFYDQTEKSLWDKSPSGMNDQPPAW
jgi:asparagine synthase (glutamine-hydrolysing)